MAETYSLLQTLASDPSGASLGLRLPAGHIIESHEGLPMLWISDEPADAELLDHLWSERSQTGLVPFLYDGAVSCLQQPEEPDATLDATSVLAGWATRYRVFLPDHDPSGSETSEALIEMHRGPRSDERDPDRLAPKVAYHHRQDTPFAALAPGNRGSDILCTSGWTGPVNYGDPVQYHAAVMRAWEDEFDARVVALAADSLSCSVASPPTDFEPALALAHQQLAFCPDLAGEFDSVNTHAAWLIGESAWSFFWD